MIKDGERGKRKERGSGREEILKVEEEEEEAQGGKDCKGMREWKKREGSGGDASNTYGKEKGRGIEGNGREERWWMGGKEEKTRKRSEGKGWNM